MSRQLWWVGALFAVALVLGSSSRGLAQADPQNYLFNTGQTIQPFFAGWAHNPDGSFEMHFGYLNRNYVDEQHVPIGPNNRFESGDADRGQPTFFYPRVNRRVFSVTVPADFDEEEELVWTVTVGDETHRAVGWLQAEWEIDPNPFARFAGGDQAANHAPTLAVDAPRSVSLPGPLTMTATVTDDGLPPPRERRRGGGNVLPTFEPEGPRLPVNVPQIQTENRLRPTRAEVGRLTVSWTQWRGPTGVALDVQGEPGADQATVTATFKSPGDYVFHVQASDGLATVTEAIAVTVR